MSCGGLSWPQSPIGQDVTKQHVLGRPARQVDVARPSRGKLAAAAFEVVDRQANLFQVVGTLRPPGRFPRRLHRGQQQGHQDADNGYHDQQLYQIKPDRFLDSILVPPHRLEYAPDFSMHRIGAWSMTAAIGRL